MSAPIVVCGPAGARLAVLAGLCWAVLALAGCGFQLRGAVDIPPSLSPLYIQGAGFVGQTLRGRLEGSGVPLTDSPAGAGLRLRVLGEVQDSRVVAVDRLGRAVAYSKVLRVSFDALDRAGEPVLPAQMVELERTFDDDPNVSVLGKQQEADIIFQTMADDAADQVLLRLRAALAARGGGVPAAPAPEPGPGPVPAPLP